MKLRIQGNSIRLRLKQREVQQLAQTGIVEDRVSFGESHLIYRLRAQSQAGHMHASFADHIIEVVVPVQQVAQWAHTEQVGMEHAQPLPQGAHLHILVEKDFKCLANRPGEDESDSFPHPAEGDMKC